jgi:arginine decarboxylase-like protein
MSKYGSGLTINDVCKLEVAEAKEILKKYHVSEEDTQAITDMITEAYFQLSESAAAGRAFGRLFEEVTEKCAEKEYFGRYLALSAEEKQKFPFEACEECEGNE